jgi:hypothetical protein
MAAAIFPDRAFCPQWVSVRNRILGGCGNRLMARMQNVLADAASVAIDSICP